MKSTRPVNHQLRRWSLLFVATLASGLQMSLITSNSEALILQAPAETEVVASSQSSSAATDQQQQQQYELGLDDDLGTTVINVESEILLPQEFYFYRPDDDLILANGRSSSSSVSSNSVEVDSDPNNNNRVAPTTQANINFRPPPSAPNGTVCRPEVGSNRSNGAEISCNSSTDSVLIQKSETTTPRSDNVNISTSYADMPTGTNSYNNNINSNSNTDTQTNSSSSGSGGGGKLQGGESGKVADGKSSGANNRKFSSKESPYCLGSRDSDSSFNWLCQGLTLVKVPNDLRPTPVSLRLSNTGIETLTRKSFSNYTNTLRDFSMENAPRLLIIEEGTFADLVKLRVVYIFQAPKLVSFDYALTGLHPDLTIIHIQQTGLRSWPNLSGFKQQERILNSLDFVNNRIATLGQQPMNIRTELLNLGFNLISSIDEYTFNGSEIGTLSLSGNRRLNFIHPNAFANLKNLIKLDLSSTSVAQLPSLGLHQLRTLIIQDTYTLKRIPSIYVFSMLEEAHLTYAYHCCSFQYPQRHDPSAYEDHLRLQEDLNKLCGNRKDETGSSDPPEEVHQRTGSVNGSDGSLSKEFVIDQQQQQQQTSTQNSDFEGYFEMEQKVGIAVEAEPTATAQPIGIISSASNQQQQQQQAKVAGNLKTGDQLEKQLNAKWLINYINCGELAFKNAAFPNITCTPEPDAFNPCEDIMGYSVLRVAVWFVVGASVFGNMSVIVVLMGVFRRLSVPKFLQLNLAIGDLFMGIYLAMLAMADLTTVGSYFNYAIDWQHGFGCKIAGASSLFASQLSIFTLCVITFERYYTITYSIDLNMRLQLGWATRIMILGWLFAFASAMLPAFADISSYTKTSICLPMRTNDLLDRIFLSILLLIDSSAFVIIFACYLRMYLLIIRQKTEATAKERKIAMRMALLVFTDFACWAPIIFFGATALFGRPLISVTNSKILIVFFYPLNSMANPFLYVISTRQYQRDLNYLTSRWYMWRKNLFSRNNDSYYSNNGYNGAVRYTGSALNAHLGAVAAVTGVAPHHQFRMQQQQQQQNQQLEQQQQQLVDIKNEERVVCTKSNKGKYIIRHQILTDGHLPGYRGHRAYPLQALVVTGCGVAANPNNHTSGNEGSTEPMKSGSISKLVNVSNGIVAETGTGSGCSRGKRKGSNDSFCRGKSTETCLIGRDSNLGDKTKKRAHNSGRRSKYSICSDRFVERCNCCCKCYRWSGISSSRAPTGEEPAQVELEKQVVCELKQTEKKQNESLSSEEKLNHNNVFDTKSSTLFTSLPTNTTSNSNDELRNRASDGGKDKPEPNNQSQPSATQKNNRPNQPRRKCSCLAVDDIFRETIPIRQQLANEQQRCSAHHNENSCSDVDILGNISYNDPTSSVSSPQSSCPLDSGCHQQQAAKSTMDTSSKSTLKSSCCQLDQERYRRRRSCCHYGYCSSRKCSKEEPINDQQQQEVEESLASDSATHLSLSSVDLNLKKSSAHKHCHHHHHHHHRRHRHCDHYNRRHHNHHHHHHHHHKRHHRNHSHNHHSISNKSGDTEQVATNGQESLLPKTNVDHDKDHQMDIRLVNGDSSSIQQVNDGSQIVVCGVIEHKLESILKSRKDSGNSNSNGKWSPMINLLRAGSFQSSHTRNKEKKRVSIVDHHSG